MRSARLDEDDDDSRNRAHNGGVWNKQHPQLHNGLVWSGPAGIANLVRREAEADVRWVFADAS
jgi:hypothetical protein